MRVRWRRRPGSATTNRAPCGRAGSHHRRAPIDSPSRLAAYSPIPEPRAVWVSRRAYGSKIRSRHSSGMPGPSSVTPSWTTPSMSAQSIVIVVSGGAYLTAFSTRCSRIWRSRGGSARPWSRALGRDLDRVAVEDRPERRRRPRRRRSARSIGVTAAGPSGTTRTDARIESTSRSSRSICSSVARCQAARVSRRSRSRDSRPTSGGSSASRSAYARTTASGVRSSWVTRAISSLRASSIALSASTRASASDCWRPFSTMPASRSATAPSCATSDRLKSRGRSVWTLSTPTDLVVPGQRHGQHRGHEAALVDAADPQEAGIGLHVGDDQRLLRGGDAARSRLHRTAPAPGRSGTVEAVGGGQRQVRSVAVQQVERGDVGVERVAGPVDDRLEQLVPGPRGRREPQRPRGGSAAGRARPAPRGVGRAAGARRARELESAPGRASSRPSPYKPREGCGRERLRPVAGCEAVRSAGGPS